MKKFEMVALGECLVDFLVVKGDDPDKICMEGAAGGAPFNVMAAAAKLGRKTTYITKVGRDAFGDFLRGHMEAAGVDSAGVVSGSAPTTLAMVSLDATGNRSFNFYRNQTADVTLEQYEVDNALVTGCGLFHFGAVSMTAQPAAATTLAAAATARQAGVKVSFDPNHRPVLWDDDARAVAAMKQGLALTDYLKVSEEEATMLTGEADPEKAALSLLAGHHLTFVAVTLGPKGCVGISDKARVKLPTYDLPCVDTTGAGDAFWGAALHQLLLASDGELDEGRITEILQFANAAGALATTKYGALPALADEKQILRCIQKEKLLI